MALDINLRLDNPFSIGYLLSLSDSSVELIGPTAYNKTTEEDRLYTTIQGDNFSDIAYEAYGTSKYWWVIWLANEIDFPFELELLPNTTLRIPDLNHFLNNYEK